MLLAAIGDIRGDLAALEAVLAALDNEGIQTIVQTGNIAVGGPYPGPVIALLRDRNIPCVQGEEDRILMRAVRKHETLAKKLPPDLWAAVQQAYADLTSAEVEFLRHLPRQRALSVDGVSISISHGLPAEAREMLSPETSRSRLQRQREAVSASLYLSGGGPEFLAREIDGALFICPGPLQGPAGPRYALISTEALPWTATLVDVAASGSGA